MLELKDRKKTANAVEHYSGANSINIKCKCCVEGDAFKLNSIATKIKSNFSET